MEGRANGDSEADATRSHEAQVAYAALTTSPRPEGRATLLVLSFVVFAMASLHVLQVRDLAIVVGVLLLHEGGHLLGMRLFGFSDLRMLFLPFLGAAVSGRKLGASAVERATVSLLGPLPGLVLALVLAFFVAPDAWKAAEPPPLATAALMLVLINGFNLIPVLPLDGGQLFQQLLFARLPTLDVAFRVLAVGAIAWFAWVWEPVFWVLVFFMVVRLRQHTRLAFEAARLRRAGRFPNDPEQLGEEQLAQLHEAAVYTVSHVTRLGDETRRRVVDQAIQDLYERTAQRAPRWWQAGMLLLLWGLSLVVAFVSLVVMFRPELVR